MQYTNFDLTFNPHTPAGYAVSAASRLGQVPETGQPALLSALNPSDPALAAALEAVRRGRADDAALQALGQTLAAALPEAVVGLLKEQRAAARAQAGQGLRLRLHLSAPEVAELPWELLWLPGDPGPLCVSTDSVITRSLDLRVPVRDLEAPRPLRLLALAPQAPSLNLAEHKQALEQAVAPMQTESVLTLEWLGGVVTRDRIRQALMRAPAHLVHFVGHGSFVKGAPHLHLNDDYGDDYPVPAETVAGLFQNQPSLRLVVLNACRGAAVNSADALRGLTTQIAAQGLPAIIAMQWDIYDWAAQKFAAAFYGALCAGPAAGEVDTALTQARAALYADDGNSRGYATPVLLLRAVGERLWGETAATGAEAGLGEVRDSVVFGDQATVHGDVVRGDQRKVDTGGGAYVEGDITVSNGDLVFGRKTVTQRAGRDIIGRDKITHASGSPEQMQALLARFDQIQARIDALAARPAVDQDEVRTLVEQIEAESQQGDEADPDRLERWLTALGDAAEDIFEVTAAALVNPAFGVAQAVRRVAQRVLDKRARGRRGTR
jgi:hypothetical protein